MKRDAARWIPRLLNDKQKRARSSFAQSFLKQSQVLGERFLNIMVSVDEILISTFDPENAVVCPTAKDETTFLLSFLFAGSQKKQMLVISVTHRGNDALSCSPG